MLGLAQDERALVFTLFYKVQTHIVAQVISVKSLWGFRASNPAISLIASCLFAPAPT